MTIEAPDVVWVADLTYIRLPSTFVYLAAILDAYSRKCVGWKLSKRIDLPCGWLTEKIDRLSDLIGVATFRMCENQLGRMPPGLRGRGCPLP